MQREARGVVQHPVADRVGLVRIPDQGMPVRDREELAGDEGRGALGAVLDDLTQVAAFGVAQRREQPVVDREQVGLGQPREEAGV